MTRARFAGARPGDLVVVTWHDAFDWAPGWKTVDDVRDDPSPAVVRTVGWVVDIDLGGHLVVTMQVQVGARRIGATMSIPHGNVVRVDRLGRARRAEELA